MRVLHLRDRARDAIHALAPRGSPDRPALMQVLRELMDERVPLVGPGDRALRHGSTIMGRPVPGSALLVCYVPAGDELFLVNVIRGF